MLARALASRSLAAPHATSALNAILIAAVKSFNYQDCLARLAAGKGHAGLIDKGFIASCREQFWSALTQLVPADHPAWLEKRTDLPGDPSDHIQFRLLGLILAALGDPDWDFPYADQESAARGVRLCSRP